MNQIANLKKVNLTKLVSLLTMITIFSIVLAFSTISKATTATPVDVTPPWVRLSIVGATESNGVNYVSETEVEVEIYAYDDTCAASEIEYYISDTPIDNTQELADELWDYYQIGLTKTFTITDLTATNTIYAIFRDPTGNTTLIYEGADVEYTINYHTNTGESEDDVMLQATGIHGMAYIVTNQVPKREGYYFLGWATSSTATSASYEQGDIISATSFKGSDKVIDLYAVWTNNIADLPLLIDKVEIGDYVAYPLDYENVYIGSSVTSKRGWRVLSKDVDLDGNESIGTINIVSAGTPMSYYHGGATSTSVEQLLNNFLEIEFDDITVQQKFIKNGLRQYSTLTEAFTNKFTLMNGTTPKVRAMKNEDILRATGLATMQSGTIMDLANPKYEQLWKIDVNYWLASANNTSFLWSVNNYGGVYDYLSSVEYGVRPVVSLKSGIRTHEKDSAGRWSMEISE